MRPSQKRSVTFGSEHARMPSTSRCRPLLGQFQEAAIDPRGARSHPCSKCSGQIQEDWLSIYVRQYSESWVEASSREIGAFGNQNRKQSRDVSKVSLTGEN